MSKFKLATPKGFRDYLPADSLKRQFVLEKIIKVFARFGFDPLETPTLEYAETLTGKYGEEEKLIYNFKTPGGDKVALRYDLTVPLARTVAQYGPSGAQTLTIPFKRYQIQSAFRGENPQKGRYREFTQCDADLVGISTPLADAETLALVYEIYKSLGLEVIIVINDRSLLQSYDNRILPSFDKLKKIGKDGVLAELQQKGFSNQEADQLLQNLLKIESNPNLDEIVEFFVKMGYPREALEFNPTLIRGLDYYTGLIIEVVLKTDPTSSSLGGGGRYDKLIGQFTNNNLPAVGFSVGLDRTIEAMSEQALLDIKPTQTQVLVTIFSADLLEKSLQVTSQLRSNNINCELYLDPEAKLDKQLKYADQKGIPYAVIIGPEEARLNQLVLKELSSQTQQTLTIDEVITRIK